MPEGPDFQMKFLLPLTPCIPACHCTSHSPVIKRIHTTANDVSHMQPYYRIQISFSVPFSFLLLQNVCICKHNMFCLCHHNINFILKCQLSIVTYAHFCKNFTMLYAVFPPFFPVFLFVFTIYFTFDTFANLFYNKLI